MSKSRHVTVKGVFGDKSVKQIKQMIEENDLDVELLREKKQLKLKSRKNREIRKSNRP